MPSSTTKPGFYAVAKGRKPGIYTEWVDCKAQILNHIGAKYKKFPSPSEAASWIESNVGSDVARAVMDAFLELNPAFQTVLKALSQSSLEAHDAPSVVCATAEGSSLAASAGSKLVAQPTTATAASSTGSVVQPAESESWVVYSDGSCRGNGKPGAVAGIGIWWGKDDPRNTCERCPGDQTNNRAELIAIIRVLETAPIDKRPLVIKTDSAYSINCLTSWLPSWKRNGWRAASGKPLLNVPVIKYADVLLQERREFAKQPVELVKVRGHSGEEGNEGADRLANLGATMPVMPERDWEDLIVQTRANRANVLRPVQEAAITQDDARRDSFTAGTPSANGNAEAQLEDLSPVASDRPAVRTSTRDSSPSEPTARDRRVMVPRRSKPNGGAKQSTSTASVKTPSAQQETVYGDPNIDISPEELELYAGCILSDDEFLNEANLELASLVIGYEFTVYTSMYHNAAYMLESSVTQRGARECYQAAWYTRVGQRLGVPSKPRWASFSSGHASADGWAAEGEDEVEDAIQEDDTEDEVKEGSELGEEKEDDSEEDEGETMDEDDETLGNAHEAILDGGRRPVDVPQVLQ